MASYYFSNLCCQVSLMKWGRHKADVFLCRVLSISPLEGSQFGTGWTTGCQQISFPKPIVLVLWKECHMRSDKIGIPAPDIASYILCDPG
jgi:hypothetical protein